MINFCNLSENEKELISDAILSSVMNEVKDVYIENRLQHKNAYSMLIWDFIGSRVIDALDSTRLKVKKIKRGRYSFDLILDEENQTAYTIMKKSNIQKVKKEKSFSHYLWALASINYDLKVEEGQFNLFSLDGEDSYREATRKELFKNVDAIITRYCTIVINDDNRQFPTIELQVFDMNLNCIYEETWKESLVIDYSFNIENTPDEEDVLLNVKLKEELNDNILKIKNEEDKQLKKEG